MTRCLPLQFKESFHVEVIEPESVFLFSEKITHLLKGKIYSAIAQKIKDQPLTEEELVEGLKETFLREEIYYALERLLHGNFVIQQEALPKGLAAFCEHLDVPSHLIVQRLKNKTVAIQNFSSQDTSELEEQFKRLSIGLQKEGDLTVVLVEDYLDERIAAWAIQAKKAWLLVKPVGKEVWIGPLFEKGGSPCYSCLFKRLQGNRLEERYVQNQKKTSAPLVISKAFISSTVDLAYDLAATLVFKWIVEEGHSANTSEVLSFDVTSFETKKHALIPSVGCLCASYPALEELAPLVLHNHKKFSAEGGGYRTAPAETTLKKYAHLVSPITGVVSNLTANKTGKINVYTAGHNFAFSNVESLHPGAFRSASGGKGKTDMQAKVGALCEAIERYSFLYQGYEPKLTGSYHDLKEKALHPSLYTFFSETQYALRHEPRLGKTEHVPEAFCEKAIIDWTPLWSLRDKTYKYVPSAYCYYGYPKEKGGRFFVGDSNGCAAGNTLEEALLQGFLELVERDSVALWWYNRVQRPCVDLSSFQDPFFETMKEEYGKLGREIWVLDLTTDLNIPVFVALSRAKEGEKEGIILGFGAHLSAQIAIERALTEMNQSLSFTEQVHELREDDRYSRWYHLEKLQNHLYLQGKGIKTKDAYTEVKREGILEDLVYCQHVVEELGMEMLIQDATRLDIGLSAVRVIVPGLRHFWPRFAPGRLYDAPVKLGWLSAPCLEKELNPIAMFL